MCCLFGLVDFKNRLSPMEKRRILSILGIACEARGVDATGFSYTSQGKLFIEKKAVPARRMDFTVPADARVTMGHTRMTTQGSAARQRNNHPFLGILPHNQFALAHNGVLTNDRELRRQEHLPKTNIETDSYVAVQLIEKQKALDFGTLRTMAESVKGTFNFTVMDRNNRLFLIKGNNPLCLYEFDDGFYLYASTKAILDTGLKAMGYHNLPHQEIPIADGEILRIDPSGRMTLEYFQPPVTVHYCYPPYTYLWDEWEHLEDTQPDGYRKYLMDYARLLGVPERELQYLNLWGLSDFELEECVYDRNYRNLCLLETGYYDEWEETVYEHDCVTALPW